MGVVEGVCRVRGWMVTQSTSLCWGCPMTVSRKSIVLLRAQVRQPVSRRGLCLGRPPRATPSHVVHPSRAAGDAPQVVMDADLDAHAPAARVLGVGVEGDGPAVGAQACARLRHHVSDEVAAAHEGGAQRLGAGPRLGAAAVEVDAGHVRRHEGRGAGELDG